MDLQEKLCLNLCSYYKPSKDENIACLGFLVISRLIANNKEISFGRPADKHDEAIALKLALDMCILCQFYENDCDFIAGNNNALPCGGFILLADLIRKEVFTMDDIITEGNSFRVNKLERPE